MKSHLKAGFTIVEIVIALSLISILSVIALTFFTNALADNARADAKATLLSEAQQTLDAVTNDIRLSANADEANRWPDENAPGAPSNEFSWASDNDTLVLAAAAEDEDKNIIFEDAVEYISWKNNYIYFVQNGTLYRRTLAADVAGNAAKTTCPAASASSSCPPDKVMAHSVNVERFTINYLDGDNNEVTPTDARSVELTLSLKTKAFGNDVKAEYKTRMVFRND